MRVRGFLLRLLLACCLRSNEEIAAIQPCCRRIVVAAFCMKNGKITTYDKKAIKYKLHLLRASRDDAHIEATCVVTPLQV